MTHRYTLLVGGTILPGRGQSPAEAIAWAEGTVLVLGTEAQVRAASRGDSEVLDLRGAYAVPLGTDDVPTWPPDASLEIGGPADLALLESDPRADGEASPPPLAIVRGGHVVRGHWPSTS